MDEEISWWNRLCGSSDSLNVEENCLKCPSVESIIYVFSKISPFLVIVLSDYTQFHEPWDRLRNILQNLFPNSNEIPNPNNNFQDFLDFLYSVKDQLQIDTPEKVIAVLNCFQNVRKPQFLLWSVPDQLDNMPLYFETIHEMVINKSPYMKRFFMGVGNCDLFFDRFLPMINNTTPEISMLIVEVLSDFFHEKLHSIYHAAQTISTFFEQLLIGMQSDFIPYSISCFRSARYLIIASKNLYASNHMNDWLMKVINATFDVPHLHSLAVKYVMNLKTPKFPFITLARKLLDPKTLSVENLSLVEDLLNMQGFPNKFSVLQLLFNLTVQDKLWSKAATRIIQSSIGVTVNKDDIMTWLTSVTKRTFIFVGAAAMNKKYIDRRMLILTVHESLFKLKIDWYNKPVQRMYSSLINSKKMPRMNINIPIERTTDYRFLGEVEAASKKNLKLMLVLSEPIENSNQTKSNMRPTTSFRYKTPRPSITKPTKKPSPITKVKTTAKINSKVGTTKVTTTLKKKCSTPNVIVRVKSIPSIK